MCSRDATVLIDLMLCTTPACFSTFFSIYYGPYSSRKFLACLVVSFFGNTIITIMSLSITDEPMHTASKNGTVLPQLYQLVNHPRRFGTSYVSQLQTLLPAYRLEIASVPSERALIIFNLQYKHHPGERRRLAGYPLYSSMNQKLFEKNM